jgi:hypothetical protein
VCQDYHVYEQDFNDGKTAAIPVPECGYDDLEKILKCENDKHTACAEYQHRAHYQLRLRTPTRTAHRLDNTYEWMIEKRHRIGLYSGEETQKDPVTNLLVNSLETQEKILQELFDLGSLHIPTENLERGENWTDAEFEYMKINYLPYPWSYPYHLDDVVAKWSSARKKVKEIYADKGYTFNRWYIMQKTDKYFRDKQRKKDV